MQPRRLPVGFTLVELVVVIAITGIIAGVVAVFLKQPIQGYFDAARRAEMTDTADTALRRMAREIKLALPNSIRITDAGQTLEFLLTRTGGRYRTEGTGFLDFSQATTSFAQLGPMSSGVGQSVVAGDQLVIYNLGIAGADAYAGDNSAVITSVDNSLPNEPVLNFTPKQFPFESPDARFQVVAGAVTYACQGAGNMNLTRYSGYATTPAQTSAAGLAASAAARTLAANNVSACTFSYNPGVTTRAGLVTLILKITLDGESVQLYQEAHVSNVP